MEVDTFTTLKAIVVAAAFMMGVGWLGICTGQSEVVTGARVGYWVIAAYGLGAVVRASLGRWAQFSRTYRESRAHNQLVLRRWHRMKSLGGPTRFLGREGVVIVALLADTLKPGRPGSFLVFGRFSWNGALEPAHHQRLE